MNDKDTWEEELEWVRVLAKSSNPRDIELLISKVRVAITTAVAAERGRLRKLMEDGFMYLSATRESDLKYRDGWNDCRKDVLALLLEDKAV